MNNEFDARSNHWKKYDDLHNYLQVNITIYNTNALPYGLFLPNFTSIWYNFFHADTSLNKLLWRKLRGAGKWAKKKKHGMIAFLDFEKQLWILNFPPRYAQRWALVFLSFFFFLILLLFISSLTLYLVFQGFHFSLYAVHRLFSEISDLFNFTLETNFVNTANKKDEKIK